MRESILKAGASEPATAVGFMNRCYHFDPDANNYSRTGVLALHVAPPPALESLSGVPDFVERAIPSEQELAAFVAPVFPDLKLTARVQLGSAWDVIVEAARLERADLIVMCTHGHDSLADRLLGSHTERVIGHAPCPVLVV